MSTELGEIQDCFYPDSKIEVAMSTGKIMLFSKYPKSWLDRKGAEDLIDLLEQAVSRSKDGS